MVATALAVAGVVGALSLAGIFIVYLIDTIGGDDSSKPAQVQPNTTGATAPALPDGASGASGPTGSAGSGASPGAKAPGALPQGATGNNPKLNRIPDNQQFENFKNSSAGYSIDFPKGWTTNGRGNDVTWSFGKNSERVVMARAAAQKPRQIQADFRNNKQVRVVLNPRYVSLGALRPIRVTFQQLGAKNDQGDPIKIFVDEYKFYRGGKIATLDLVTTGAVRRDNANEFDRIARSFRWG
jgi:hypothetical protein